MLFVSDVNECEDGEKGGCAHSCNNYEGGFSCSCDDGYTLAEDGLDCLSEYTQYIYVIIMFLAGGIMINFTHTKT